jgi:hypothetical protein
MMLVELAITHDKGEAPGQWDTQRENNQHVWDDGQEIVIFNNRFILNVYSYCIVSTTD